jgi:hypothetical protein
MTVLVAALAVSLTAPAPFLAFGWAAIVLPVLNAAPDASAQSGIATTASSVSASTAADLAAIPTPTMS